MQFPWRTYISFNAVKPIRSSARERVKLEKNDFPSISEELLEQMNEIGEKS